jgi:hypothetical protein
VNSTHQLAVNGLVDVAGQPVGGNHDCIPGGDLQATIPRGRVTIA